MNQPASPASRPGRRLHAGFGVVAFALAFLLTTAYAQQTGKSKASEDRRRRLAALVVDRQGHASAIERELAVLRDRAQALGAGTGPAVALRNEIDRLSALAGTTALSGPGLSVVLADSPLADQEGSPDFLIQDVDLQLIVNELWNAGAEAIAVNGQRIVSTTAVRSAGRAILINYKVLTSPYRVDAIGDGRGMRTRFERSRTADRFRTWAQVYRLSMKIDLRKRLTIPAYAGRLRLEQAAPVRSAT